ncbi:hypothetical protein IWX76_000627 [Pedobacter sp. CAN_A7]|uniref:hypothetical protein n=1 Tax=Pedobacter sp. CAN_A7 TaxID=2787722 RepID=UPI0018C94588
MKSVITLCGLSLVISACQPSATMDQSVSASAIRGTWKLVSNIIITKGDTVVAYPVKGKDDLMIKMFNDTHFSFFRHDILQGKTAEPIYDTGAGTYTLVGNDYTEKLEYCNYRDWENHEFKFKLSLKGDTLRQQGFEKIDSLNIDREIIETYAKIK